MIQIGPEPSILTKWRLKVRSLLITGLLLAPAFVVSQQTIRGLVIDRDTRITLPGVNVVLQLDSGEIIGTATDEQGRYRLENVPYGRRDIEFRSIGHVPVKMQNIIIGSGREVILNVEMEENVTELKEFEVIAGGRGEVRNEMALISARQFSVEETERYAGSRGDPGRMASNYAGIQGADDSRNDIVIRGNSPQGVLWRFEGIDIPNPNHFAIPGTSGGPVTILNNKYLANSDLFTAAFPAEYGNSIAGVFDLRMRNGNSERHELAAQLGFLGTELLAEGPIGRKGRASYLLSYRYSTLQLFGFMGIEVGTDAIPKYQDGAFRINLPIGRKSDLALWGIGGSSSIDIVLSDQERPDTTTLIYGDNDRDQYFTSRMATSGATYSYMIDEGTYLRSSFAVAHAQVRPHHYYIYRHVEQDRYVVDSLPRMLGYRSTEEKLAWNTFLVRKFGKRTKLKAGLNIERQRLAYIDSARALITSTGPILLDDWRVRWDTTALVTQVQPYAQLKHRFGERLTVTFGLHAFHSSINTNSTAPIEPRFGASFDPGGSQRIAFGYGLHSQLQPQYLYFFLHDPPDEAPRTSNNDMGLTKSHHLVLGYDRMAGEHIRLKSEIYYQHLFNIPVQVEPSSFSLVNTGAGFERLYPDSLENSGIGRNMGVELTIEHPFRKGYYFLVTGSLFDARYRGSDRIWRNTSFNGRYAANALLSREFTLKKSSAISIGGKLTWTGGRWYGPVDRAASDAAQELVYVDRSMNTLQFKPYFRADLKIGYRWNRPKVMHEFSLDLINISDRKNILTLTYAPGNATGEPIREEFQLGLLPIFYYKIEL